MQCDRQYIIREQGLSRLNASSVSFGHPEARTLFFDSFDTQRFMSEFADDDFS